MAACDPDSSRHNSVSNRPDDPTCAQAVHKFSASGVTYAPGKAANAGEAINEGLPSQALHPACLLFASARLSTCFRKQLGTRTATAAQTHARKGAASARAAHEPDAVRSCRCCPSPAGGVAVSGLEMSQNRLGLKWTREEVQDRLQNIMRDIYEASKSSADEYGVDLASGANIAGFLKVGGVCAARGAARVARRVVDAVRGCP